MAQFNLSRSLRRSLPLVAAAACGAAILNAAPQSVYAFHSSRAIGTTLEVHVATQGPAAAEDAFGAVSAEISRLEAMLSTRIPTSFISQINQTNQAVVVPQEVIELLTAYGSASTLTGGLISPLAGELTARWAGAAKQNLLPGADELAAITARIHQTTLVIDAEKSTVQRIGPATLNIDALGKPFILAKATHAAWSTGGLGGVLVNIGGDIMTRGTAAGSAWTVDVANGTNAADNAAPLATLNMTKASVVTSGDYARPRSIAGQNVSHIINPLTGQPAAQAIAVTVMHDDPVLANALSTVFCIAGPSAARLADKINAEFLLASPMGVQISEKLPMAADAASGSATQPATQPAATDWPKDFKASLALKIVSTGRPEKEYVAIWIEDEKGNYVKTLAVWGTDKYQRQALSGWIKKNIRVARPVSGPTKAAGTYTVNWDGTDQSNKAVGQGKYTLRVEASSEHGGHYNTTTVIDCGGESSTTTIKKVGALDVSTVTYGGPKPKDGA